MFASSFKPLTTLRAADHVDLARPERHPPITLHAPALDAMTDFTRLQPITISADTHYLDANDSMIRLGVRLLLVVDARQHLLGIVSAHDILGERPLQIAGQDKGRLAEVTVGQLMHAVADIDMLALADVRHAQVGDIIATLKQLARQHLLVVTPEGAHGGMRLCGMFSATQIARQLGSQEVQPPFEIARTFAQIEAALAH